MSHRLQVLDAGDLDEDLRVGPGPEVRAAIFREEADSSYDALALFVSELDSPEREARIRRLLGMIRDRLELAAWEEADVTAHVAAPLGRTLAFRRDPHRHPYRGFDRAREGERRDSRFGSDEISTTRAARDLTSPDTGRR